VAERQPSGRWWLWLLGGLLLAALAAALIVWWRPIYEFVADQERIRYGPFSGTLWPMIGMVIGSFLLFQLSRRFGRPLLIKLIGRKSMDRLDDLVRRGGAPFFFLIWLVPFAPDDLACAAAGLTPMSTGQFLILMLLGRLPGVFVSVWVGANVARISPLLWALLFAAIAVAVLAFWRWGELIQEAVLRFMEGVGGRFGG